MVLLFDIEYWDCFALQTCIFSILMGVCLRTNIYIYIYIQFIYIYNLYVYLHVHI